MYGPINLLDLYNNPENYSDFIWDYCYQIYRIRNKLNNKSYIGDCKEIHTRFFSFPWGSHFECFEDTTINKHLYNSMRKYGLHNFEVGLVYYGEYEYDLEEKFINLYDSFHNGYNDSLSGKGFMHGTNYSTRWVNNGSINKLISINNLNYMLSIGWKIGRLGAPNKGLIAITNGEVTKYILESKFSEYESIGFKRGSNIHSNKGKISIYKDEETLMVDELQLSEYLSLGYNLGKSYSSIEGRVAIHNSECSKFINENELDYYLSNGFKLGTGRSSTEDTICMMDLNGNLHYINYSDYDNYRSLGWIKSGANKNTIYLSNKNNKVIRIYPTDENIKYYASLGYAKGRKWSTSTWLWDMNKYKDLFSKEEVDFLLKKFDT